MLDMLLVDKQIKELSSSIIVSGYDEGNVTAVSYDLSIDSIILENGDKNAYSLLPNETVFVKTQEKIKMPHDLLGRIGEKNSIMRLGLVVSGPHYYPGHETYLYLRVQNITQKEITIKRGDKIAQIFFEQLADTPENTYDMQKGASFNYENTYRGFGKYQDMYETRIRKLEKAEENLENKESSIYANIMTIMGVFVSIFSLIMVNFSNLKENVDAVSVKNLITVNVSLGVIIALFIGLMLIFLNKAKDKKFLVAYGVIMTVLIVAMIVLLIV